MVRLVSDAVCERFWRGLMHLVLTDLAFVMGWKRDEESISLY